MKYVDTMITKLLVTVKKLGNVFDGSAKPET